MRSGPPIKAEDATDATDAAPHHPGSASLVAAIAQGKPAADLSCEDGFFRHRELPPLLGRLQP